MTGTHAPAVGARVGYRIAWRTLGRRIDGSPLMVVDSVRVPSAADLPGAARACAGRAHGGDLRIDADGGGRVYTSLAQIDAWDGAEGTLPPAAVFSVWARDVRRAGIVGDLLARLRAAFARAVVAGVVHEAAAVSIVRIAERAAADPDAIAD